MGSNTSKKIAIIGGAGFIGHHLALHLKKLGHEVALVDGLKINSLLYLHSTNLEILNRELYIKYVNTRLDMLREAKIPLYVEDARDYLRTSIVLEEIKPQVVILLAAVAHDNRSNKNPFETFDHSLRTLENVLDATRKRVEHFIYFSSSMAYGHFKSETVDEETICDPIGIYGNLKLAGERIVKAYHNVFDLPYTIVRPSALYGERCISRRVSQIFVENALMGQEIVVNGDGSDRLDFTYIDDLCQGVDKIIENKNSLNQTFNLTYGASRSIANMADIIRENFPNIKIKYIPKDKLTADRGTLSVEKARSLIGYDPQFPLEKGYVKYINWYKDFFKKNNL